MKKTRKKAMKMKTDEEEDAEEEDEEEEYKEGDDEEEEDRGDVNEQDDKEDKEDEELQQRRRRQTRRLRLRKMSRNKMKKRTKTQSEGEAAHDQTEVKISADHKEFDFLQLNRLHHQLTVNFTMFSDQNLCSVMTELRSCVSGSSTTTLRRLKTTWT